MILGTLQTKSLRTLMSLAFFLWAASFFSMAKAAPPLRIVGSSAVFPFAATVAEHFSYKTHAPIPLVESIGTGAGIKIFCATLQGPDGVMTSRSFTKGEERKCAQTGVTYQEFKIGQDGLVVIQNRSSAPFSLTLKDLRKALGETLEIKGQCQKNPFKTWNEIQPTFPNLPIRVLGPAPTSGTYDVLVEKIEGNCGRSLRRDRIYIEAPANENLIVQKVIRSLDRLGIITFSFYDQNKDKLHGIPLNGILPSMATIQRGIYPLSRPLYLYIKTNELKKFPMRAAYVLEMTSLAAVGQDGYLLEKGLIPLSKEEENRMKRQAQSLTQEAKS